MPPRIATWRYDRGNRSLTANLSAGDGKSHTTPSTVHQSISQEQDISEEIEIADEVEEVIDQLIQGLRCYDGVVR